MPTDSSSDLLYLICLNRLEGVGCKTARKLIELFGSAEAAFKAKEGSLQKAVFSFGGEEDLKAVNRIRTFREFADAEKELRYMDKHKIRGLTLDHPDYPQRLLNCKDRPVLLFYQGKADLNHPRMISVVGTRKSSEYGRQLTEQLCHGLSASGCIVVSGLAYGIDAIAHQAALDASLETVGVLAHGLSIVYPPRHATLSRALRERGGLLSEYSSGEPALRYRFPQRNRIVAGMTTATVVVESPRKGGSLITADLAESYNRDVFAFPGRTTDLSMAGNHDLIRKNKAAIITNAEDLLEMLGWPSGNADDVNGVAVPREPVSFFEQPVFNCLSAGEPVPLETIQNGCGLSSGAVAEALLFLEIKGWIRILPGQRYVLRLRNDSG